MRLREHSRRVKAFIKRTFGEEKKFSGNKKKVSETREKKVLSEVHLSFS